MSAWNFEVFTNGSYFGIWSGGWKVADIEMDEDGAATIRVSFDERHFGQHLLHTLNNTRHVDFGGAMERIWEYNTPFDWHVEERKYLREWLS